MRLQDLTVDGDTLAALDDETAAALIAYRYEQLQDVGLSPVNALVLAARTDRSLESITSSLAQGVGAAA
ncbi:MAG TPA: hypothetical protein VH541_05990 [Gaiellaceae bacterium]|jgi:hypothetical protein